MSSRRWSFVLVVACFTVAACESTGTPMSGEASDLQDPVTTTSTTPTVVDRTSTTTIATIDREGEIEIEIDLDGTPELHIVRGENDLVLTGRVDKRTADRLLEVAAVTAERHDLELTSSLSEGSGLDDRTREAIEEFLGTSMGHGGDGIVALEARLAADSFRVWAVRQDDVPIVIGELSAAAFATAGIEREQRVDRPGVSDAESEIVEDLLAFALGDREAASSIPWADEVALAFGPILAEITPTEDLLEPATWTVDVGPFRGGDGPISLLPSADATWSTPTAGPHPHCASPPVAAPQLLAGLRRISVQTTGIDSCLRWRTLDVFIGNDGRVAGVSTDIWEP